MQIAEHERQRLETDAAYIREHHQRVYDSIVTIGKRLLEVQARLKNDKVFVLWMSQSFDFSPQTAYNYMNVAKRLETAQIAPDTPLRALYDACKPSANVGAVAALKRSEEYSVDGWYILSNAPQYLIDSWEGERISEGDAKETAQYLRGKAIHPDVRTYALTHQIHRIEMLRYLNTARLDHDRTGGERTTWDDLQDTNGYLSAISQGVHVSYAGERDIDRYKVERQSLHREAVNIQYDWHAVNASVVIVDGKPMLELSGLQVIVTEGEKLFVKVRTRK